MRASSPTPGPVSRLSATACSSPHRVRSVGVALLTLALALGCGGTDSASDADSAATPTPASDSAPTAIVPPVPAPTDAPVGGDELTGDPAVDSVLAAIRACPRDGLWHPCSLEQRLQRSGLRVEKMDTATTIPGLPQPAETWLVGRQQLRLVLFPSVAAAADVMERMDVRRAAPKDDPTVFWPDRATLLHNANLIAVLLGGSERQVERVSNALMAGAPQPEVSPPH